MGGINFDPSKVGTYGKSTNKKVDSQTSANAAENTAPKVTTSNDSGKVLDSLTALGNYNAGFISSSKSSATSSDITNYLSKNPGVAAQVNGTDAASKSRISQYAVNGYNAASSAGL